MKPIRLLAALLFAHGLVGPAAAQTATLSGRLTNVFGNFVVGAGPVVDSGSFSEFLTAPLAPSYSRDAADAGAVSGEFNGQPVVGSASFASSAAYVFGDGQIVGNGSAATIGSTPFDYVSLGANAQSVVRLDFTVPVLTRAVLEGSITSVIGPNIGSRTSTAQASVSLNGVGSWVTTSHQGAFEATDTLLPGITYSLRGSGSTAIIGDAQYSFSLMLTPVPEPSSAVLLAAGLLGLGVWRRGRAHAAAGATGLT